jgi:anti-sigma28 factor (negative regulator of flagellin synthesis)
MGFNFRTAEERNPVTTGPTQEETLIQKLETQLAETQAKLEKVEQFIDENTLLQKFYAWEAIKAAISSGKIVMDDNITDVNFEEVK